MNDLFLLTSLLTVAPFTGLLATAYLAWVWWKRPRGIVLGMLVLGAAFAEVVAIMVAPLAWRASVGLRQPPDAGFVVGLAIVVCIAIPHVYAVGVLLVRFRARASN